MSYKDIAFSAKKNIPPFIMCICGLLLNLLLGMLVAKLGLPLYLDTVGTVAAAVLGGSLPGVAVGFATNMIKSISDPSSLYYGVLNVLIAVAAAHLSKNKKLKSIRGIIVMILVLTLIGGGLGTLIPWFMQGLTFDSESLSGKLYNTGFFNQEISHLLASIITDLPDKAITVVFAYIIYRIVPKNLRSRLKFTSWRQKAISDDRLKKHDRSNIRKLSLRIKMLIVFIISLSTVAFVGTLISVRVYYKSMINEHSSLAQGTANLVARELDGDKIDEYLANGGDSDDYRETHRLIEDILYSSPEISYLYVYKVEENGCYVIFDVDTDDATADKIGDFIPIESGFSSILPDLLAGEEVEPVITNDSYGNLLTAMKPVFNSNGECVCYAIADVDVEMLIKDKHSFLVEMITVFLSFLILICVFVIWLTDYHIIFPISSITMHIDRISNSGYTQKSLDRYVRKIQSLGVFTGDEIERLYQSICSMTVNQSEQMRSIRRLSEATAKMQDGLIITMANMVENRDSDTGAHVQKTSEYVKIIVEGLRAKGYYSDKITPKFMSDVVRSAPLHDVGKINISDRILNKPGRLTEEEYEIMKTHTTIGKQIMENAIISVEGDSYLTEARDMAAYHHERWDGTGYPEGLHGEEIPLSARIMAVADVFDALTSPRVYKPAFPLRDSLLIIAEGKGTQFDPKCVEVFLESLDKVKDVLREHGTEVD